MCVSGPRGRAAARRRPGRRRQPLGQEEQAAGGGRPGSASSSSSGRAAARPADRIAGPGPGPRRRQRRPSLGGAVSRGAGWGARAGEDGGMCVGLPSFKKSCSSTRHARRAWAEVASMRRRATTYSARMSASTSRAACSASRRLVSHVLSRAACCASSAMAGCCCRRRCRRVVGVVVSSSCRRRVVVDVASRAARGSRPLSSVGREQEEARSARREAVLANERAEGTGRRGRAARFATERPTHPGFHDDWLRVGWNQFVKKKKKKTVLQYYPSLAFYASAAGQRCAAVAPAAYTRWKRAASGALRRPGRAAAL